MMQKQQNKTLEQIEAVPDLLEASLLLPTR
jgi:hypothetical protein